MGPGSDGPRAPSSRSLGGPVWPPQSRGEAWDSPRPLALNLRLQHPGCLVCTPIVGTATVKVVIQVSSLFRGAGAGVRGHQTGISPGSKGPRQTLREASVPHPRSSFLSVCPLGSGSWRKFHVSKKFYSYEAVKEWGWGRSRELESSLTPGFFPPFTPGLPGLSPTYFIPSFHQRGWKPRLPTSLKLRLRGWASAIPRAPEV